MAEILLLKRIRGLPVTDPRRPFTERRGTKRCFVSIDEAASAFKGFGAQR